MVHINHFQMEPVKRKSKAVLRNLCNDYFFRQKLIYPRFGGPQRAEHGETRAAQILATLRAARAKAWEPCGIALCRGKRLGPSMVLAPPFSTKRWKKEDGITGAESGLLVSHRAGLSQRPTRGKIIITKRANNLPYHSVLHFLAG